MFLRLVVPQCSFGGGAGAVMGIGLVFRFFKTTANKIVVDVTRRASPVSRSPRDEIAPNSKVFIRRFYSPFSHRTVSIRARARPASCPKVGSRVRPTSRPRARPITSWILEPIPPPFGMSSPSCSRMLLIRSPQSSASASCTRILIRWYAMRCRNNSANSRTM